MVYDMRWMKTILAWHLPRAGIGRVPGMAVIKRRVYPNGYVEWVDVGELHGEYEDRRADSHSCRS